MNLIRELNEEAKASMSDEVLERFVKHAKEDIKKAGVEQGTDAEKLEVILSMLEDVPGYEHFKDAEKLASEVLNRVKD